MNSGSPGSTAAASGIANHTTRIFAVDFRDQCVAKAKRAVLGQDQSPADLRRRHTRGREGRPQFRNDAFARLIDQSDQQVTVLLVRRSDLESHVLFSRL